MMNIVIFLNAAHQRKYIDVLNTAMAGSTDVRVQALDISIDDAIQSNAKKSLRARLMGFRPFRLVTKFVGAAFYVPYVSFQKLLKQYRLYLHKHLRETAFFLIRQLVNYPVYAGLRKQVSGLRKHFSRTRARIPRGFSAVWRSLLRPGARFLFRLLFGVLNYFRSRSILYVVLTEYRWQRSLEHRLFSLQPDLIVLLEDNAEGLTGLVSHAARKHKVPYVILPDYIPNPAEPARYYFNNPLHSADTLTGKLVQLFAPRWIMEYDGKRLLRLPGHAILVKSIRGQHCPQPWVLNAGYTDALLLESKASLKHYESLGFKPEKLRVIGGAVEDGLHAIRLEKEERRKALDGKYKLDPTKPLIVCGFPPDQYTAATEGFEYQTYDDLCRNWFSVLATVSDRANVIVVRHPRMKAGTLSRYATGGVKIAAEPLENILPVADLYVACISTTIRWALALAIPVINYDTYRYDYGDFSPAKGCCEVTSLEAFREEMERMLRPGELEKLRVVASADAGQWGLVDGKFRNRLRDSLLEIRNNYRGLPSSTHRKRYRLQ
jgi:hypothetical protein